MQRRMSQGPPDHTQLAAVQTLVPNGRLKNGTHIGQKTGRSLVGRPRQIRFLAVDQNVHQHRPPLTHVGQDRLNRRILLRIGVRLRTQRKLFVESRLRRHTLGGDQGNEKVIGCAHVSSEPERVIGARVDLPSPIGGRFEIGKKPFTGFSCSHHLSLQAVFQAHVACRHIQRKEPSQIAPGRAIIGTKFGNMNPSPLTNPGSALTNKGVAYLTRCRQAALARGSREPGQALTGAALSGVLLCGSRLSAEVRQRPMPNAFEDGSASGEYLVVARRYRPQSFQDLVGQPQVSTALAHAIQTHRIGHAYLFTGARGVGKTSTARIFAKCLNCVDGPTAVPCNVCDICEGIAQGGDVDVLEIDGASNRGIDEIRQLRSNVHIRPSRARFKVYIIDEVHMLTMQAFNALLKTLEEPPEHVKFIFCTTDPEKIPITVLSRCQRFDFPPVEASSIVERLRLIVDQEGMEADDEALQLLARRAAGSMRDSQSLLEQLLSFCDGRITTSDVHRMLGTAQDGRLREFALALASRDGAAALQQLDTAVSAGVDAGQLAEQLLGYFRDMMAATVGCGPELMRYSSAGDCSSLADLGRQWGLETLLAILQILDQAITRMRQSMQTRVLLEIALVRIAALEDLDDLGNLVARLEASAPVSVGPRPPRAIVVGTGAAVAATMDSATVQNASTPQKKTTRRTADLNAGGNPSGHSEPPDVTNAAVLETRSGASTTAPVAVSVSEVHSNQQGAESRLPSSADRRRAATTAPEPAPANPPPSDDQDPRSVTTTEALTPTPNEALVRNERTELRSAPQADVNVLTSPEVSARSSDSSSGQTTRTSGSRGAEARTAPARPPQEGNRTSSKGSNLPRDTRGPATPATTDLAQQRQETRSEPSVSSDRDLADENDSLDASTQTESNHHSAEALWQAALARLNDSTADYGRYFESVAISAPNRLVVRFPARYTLQKERCERPQVKQRFEQALQLATGRSYRVDFELTEVGSKIPAPKRVTSLRERQRAAERHPLIQAAIELFDAEVIRTEEPRRDDGMERE